MKREVPDPTIDFEGCLEAMAANIIEATEGMDEKQANAYFLASALKHLQVLRECDQQNPLPEFLIEQAQARIARLEKRRDELCR